MAPPTNNDSVNIRIPRKVYDWAIGILLTSVVSLTIALVNAYEDIQDLKDSKISPVEWKLLNYRFEELQKGLVQFQNEMKEASKRQEKTLNKISDEQEDAPIRHGNRR